MGKRKLTEWQLLVKKVMDQNKNKPGFKFGDALKLAKKMYNPKNKTVKKGGSCGMSLGGEEDSDTTSAEPSTEPTVESQPDLEPNMSEESTSEEKTTTGGRNVLTKAFGKVHSNLSLQNSVKRSSKGLGKTMSKLSKLRLGGKNKSKKNKKGGATIENTNGGTPYFSSNN